MKFAKFTKWLYNKTHKVKISDYEAKINSLQKLVDAGEVEMRIIQSKYKEEKVTLKTKVHFFPEVDTQAIISMMSQQFGEHLFYNRYLDVRIEDLPYDEDKVVTMSLDVLKKEGKEK